MEIFLGDLFSFPLIPEDVCGILAFVNALWGTYSQVYQVCLLAGYTHLLTLNF